MNLKKIVILKNVLDILTENEMKATRGGGYVVWGSYYTCVSNGEETTSGCSSNAECRGLYGNAKCCKGAKCMED